MILNRSIGIIILICLSYAGYAQRINIKVRTQAALDSIVINSVNETYPGSPPDWTRNVIKPQHKEFIWSVRSDKALLISSEAIFGDVNRYLLEPGDNIMVEIENGKRIFSGRGAEKIRLVIAGNALKDQIKEPANQQPQLTISLDDFLEWNAYLNSQTDMLSSLLSAYESKISKPAFKRIKANLISRIEYYRIMKFFSLVANSNKIGVAHDDLIRIMDSVLNKPTAVWLRNVDCKVDNILYFDTYVCVQVLVKNYGYDLTRNEINTPAKRRVAYYQYANTHFSGHLLEQMLTYLLTSGSMKRVGFEPEIEELLAAYYKRPGFPEYKEWVRRYENLSRTLEPGNPAPEFTFTDEKDNNFTRSDLKGKVALIDFWFTGCTGCVSMTPVLKKVEAIFKNEPNVIFLSVSTDKSKGRWLKSVSDKKYTTGTANNLYTGGMGIDHPAIRSYNVTSFPRLFLVDVSGNITVNPIPDPRKDSGAALIDLINRQLPCTYDGPYVFHEGDSLKINTFSTSGYIVKKVAGNENVSLQVQTDKLEKKLDLHLHAKPGIEKCAFEKPKAIFALSDIEGNFDRLRLLLQANKIIDSNFNWTFNDGHLVFAGDMFDRGNQVTECLWLIYSLEEKAKAAGGYVHFILGNHDIMNLQGDHRYVQQKYQDNSATMAKPLTALYGNDSELGKWLRKKNVMEKIGDLLFCHAGVSSELNKLDLSLFQINETARSYYDKKLKAYPDETVSTIMSSSAGPFWYRGYYKNGKEKASAAQVDSTLRAFNVSHIITGHTIIGDTISVRYAGKVINTDTRHAKGKSEALFIEDDRYYRVNAEGKRVLLFIDERQRK